MRDVNRLERSRRDELYLLLVLIRRRISALVDSFSVPLQPIMLCRRRFLAALAAQAFRAPQYRCC